MNTHENINPIEGIEPGSDRSFGLIVGGILVAIGTYQYFTDSSIYGWTMAPGMVLVALGAIRPGLLHPLNVAWMRLGLLLGKIVTPVIMLLVFVISIIPTGLILRLFGKDLLRLKKTTTESSYWIERSPPGPAPESLKDQF